MTLPELKRSLIVYWKVEDSGKNAEDDAAHADNKVAAVWCGWSYGISFSGGSFGIAALANTPRSVAAVFGRTPCACGGDGQANRVRSAASVTDYPPRPGRT